MDGKAFSKLCKERISSERILLTISWSKLDAENSRVFFEAKKHNFIQF